MTRSANGSALVVPELGDEHKTSWAGDHTSLGYVYVFGHVQRVKFTTEKTRILIDSDRNGTIDLHQLVTSADWDNTPLYSDKANYSALPD